ncbi:MAG: UDP-N-acetylenolpyruvoylglucosamine reductase [Oscillospiraceae bacterium]|nr:UDP-N-acetylenolpyruvoylglucosamine reductase [Oscillospiraceae bacterium]
MSTREIALDIFNRLNERQLKGFIALFSPNEELYEKDSDMAERRAAFARMEKLRRPMPELDEKKELAEYREEKYGK